MIIFLRDLNHFCTGCYTCITDDKKCPFYEEKNRIMAEVESAPMKSFIDLTFNYRMAHRPRKSMFHKKAVIISTAVGSGAEKAVKYIADVLFYWGIPYILPYGICIQAMNWNGVREKKKQKIEKDTTQIANRILRKQNAKAGFKTKVMFMLMRMMQKANLGSGGDDRAYCEEKRMAGERETVALNITNAQ